MSDYRTFGEMIHDRRKRLGLTMQEVADKASISRTAVWNIEKELSQSGSGLPHRPRLETIDAICDVVGADKASARLLVYPPGQEGSQVIIGGENARLPESSSGVNLRDTINELLRQAANYREIADKLERTAAELEEFEG